jgi:dTMP kinase
MKGQLIVFEGGEGAGKTTQIQGLIPWLKSFFGNKAEVLVTREPGGTLLGKQIRELLLHSQDEVIPDVTELLLYAADRSVHVENYLKPYLAQGAIIICDRYCDSTIAYQGYGRGFDLQLIEQLNQIATGGLVSDLTLWLDVEVETGLTRVQARGKSDRLEQAELGFHHRVREGFLALAQAHPERIKRINANQSTDQVCQDIQTILREKFLSLAEKS